MEKEKELNDLVAKLKEAAGANLKCVVLYGSAVAGEFHPEHSDLNVLCVVDPLDGVELEKLNMPSAWWARKGHPAPIVLARAELGRFADVFAIELLDIKANHRVLFGEDLIAALDVPMVFHRAQVERELSSNLIRLRQSYLARKRHREATLSLMTASISTFATLFRHALLVLGEHPPARKRDVFERLASLLEFDVAPFAAILEVREGKRRSRRLDVDSTFRDYLAAAARVAEEIDRRLAVAGKA